MSTTAAPATAGAVLAHTLRASFRAGTRTPRRVRLLGHWADLHHEMVEAIVRAVQYDGWYSQAKTQALRPGYAAALSYRKHIRDGRAGYAVVARVAALSPYQFAGLLGRMVDEGVTNVGEGERFFADLAPDVPRRQPRRT